MFKLIDKNTDEVLTIDEIEKGIKHCKLQTDISNETIIQLFKDMGIDKNGLINYTEFVSSLMDYEKKVKKEHIMNVLIVMMQIKAVKLILKNFANLLVHKMKKKKKN